MGSFLERLEKEKEELNDKAKSLTIFIDSDGFLNLSRANQLLLKKQLECMSEYLSILHIRLELLKK